jgi:4-amino-4-deoxy-L-arabinose transferase-like glycosyltransferase
LSAVHLDRAARLAVALLTAAFALLAAAFAVVLPVFQAPDEPAHVDMVRFRLHHPLAVPDHTLRWAQATEDAVAMVGLPRGGPLRWDGPTPARPPYPAFRDLAPAGTPAAPGAGWCSTLPWPPHETCQNYHWGQPPTWYLAMAPVAAATEALAFPTQVLALRLGSAVLAAAAVPFTWLAGRALWPGRRGRPLVAAALVAAAGPLAGTAGTVNNDGLLLACGAAASAAAVRVVRRGHDVAGAELLGLATGAGLLVKSEFLALAPAAAACVLATLPAVPRGRRLRQLAAFVVPAAAGSVWWLRLALRYGSFSPPGSEIVRPAAPGPWEHTGPLRFALDHGHRIFRDIWGTYGWDGADVPVGWQRALAAAAAALALAWLLARRWRRPDARATRTLTLALFPLALLCGAVYASFDLYRTNGEVRGLHARYLYPAATLAAVAAAAALGAVADRLPAGARMRLRPALVAAGTVVAAAVFGGGSLLVAAHGLYATRDLGLLVERARAVAPVAPVGAATGGVLAAWAALTVAAAWAATRAVRDVPAAQVVPADPDGAPSPSAASAAR